MPLNSTSSGRSDIVRQVLAQRDHLAQVMGVPFTVATTVRFGGRFAFGQHRAPPRPQQRKNRAKAQHFVIFTHS
jgi:hypothetical protein